MFSFNEAMLSEKGLYGFYLNKIINSFQSGRPLSLTLFSVFLLQKGNKTRASLFSFLKNNVRERSEFSLRDDAIRDNYLSANRMRRCLLSRTSELQSELSDCMCVSVKFSEAATTLRPDF